MKNLKLGVKISIGFGLLIAIACALGGMAVFNMRAVEGQSTRLVQEYIPEVAIANSVERATMQTMLEMRSYGYSENQKEFDAGMRNLADLKRALAEAKAHADKYPQLVQLRDHAAKAQAKATEYEKYIAETHARIEALTAVRKTLDVAAAEIIKNSDAYLESQQKRLREEIASGVATAGLQERAEKVSGATDAISNLTAIRVGNYRGQLFREPRYIEEAVKAFGPLDQAIDAIRTKTRDEANIRQLAAIRDASQKYRQALMDYLDNFKALQDLAAKRLEASNAVQDAAEETAKAAMDATTKIAADAVASLGTASSVMLGGLAVALLLGVIIAIFLTKAITGPVIKGVAFAKAMAEGDFTRLLDIDQKDEMGVLAASLNEMVGKLREVVAEVQSASENVASGSEELSASAQSMSQGATEQAASVEEISS
ncbi:MAG: methyl-accepting chemotaxis protein, partial [Solidesulfovibrio magneticus str. Maddingley MBC34]